MTHTDERLFPCSVCEKNFVRDNDRKVHESLHTGEKNFVCGGDLRNGQRWGCGRKFALAKNLLRHYRCQTGKKCRAPVIHEEQPIRQGSRAVMELPAPKSSSDRQPDDQDTSRRIENQAVLALDFNIPINSTRFPPTPPPRPSRPFHSLPSKSSDWTFGVSPWPYPPPRLLPPAATPARLDVTDMASDTIANAAKTGPSTGRLVRPTYMEVMMAADKILDYIRVHGRLSTTKNGIHGCLELTFKPEGALWDDIGT